MIERNPFAKEHWQNKNFIRQLNRERIDFGKLIVLKIIKFLFDRPLRAFQKNQKFDATKIKKILILHFDDKIGDLVINSILFRELHKLGPQISFDLVTGKNSYELIANHPALHQVFVFRKGFFRTIFFAAKMKAQKYDLVIDPRIMTDARTIYILSQIQPLWIIGFQKQNYQIYSDSINADFNQIHTSEKMRAILQKLGIANIDLKYDLQFKKKLSLPATAPKNCIVLNLFAGARFRSFLPETGIRLIQAIRAQKILNPIVLVGPPAKAKTIQQIIQTLPNENLHFISELQKISDLAQFIQHAKLVITPDTSLVHIASNFDIPIISVFCKDSDGVEKNSIQWAPHSTFSKVIIASGRTDGEVDVNTYSESEMNLALSAAWKVIATD